MDTYFPASYEDSRARFLRDLEPLRFKWPLTRLGTHPLKNHPDLSLDWLWAEPRRHETLVIVTTGEHGLEGFAGAAVLKVFMEEFAPRLDHTTTGLLLVHAINPWGMKHRRTVNENGVDLDRNFLFDETCNPELNPDFKTLEYLLIPRRPVRSALRESLSFQARVTKAVLSVGTSRLAAAARLGQYHTPEGFFYGGAQPEEGVRVMTSLFHKALDEYGTVLLMDLHTGFGPRRRMSILIPSADPTPSREAALKFDYPRVQKTGPEQFPAGRGGMAEYIHRLREAQYPKTRVVSCSFEFGTFGASLPARLRRLRAMVLENQLARHGAENERARTWVRREFEALYFPTPSGWRRTALADGRRSFEGILKACHLLVPPAVQPGAAAVCRS